MTLLMKDPEAVLDYSIDWGAEYLGGDLVADSLWSVAPDEPGGVAVVGSDFDGTTTSVKAGGVCQVGSTSWSITSPWNRGASIIVRSSFGWRRDNGARSCAAGRHDE